MTQPNTCLVECSLTPEYVLDVLRDNYRHQQEYDPETEPDIELGFSTPVAQWRLACDLLSWQPLGRALGECWRFEASPADWRAVLEPARVRTLWDVCSFIAARGTRLDVVPSRLLGACCVSGGMFLAVRELLAQAGADVSRLRPSDAIAPFVDQHYAVFLGPVAALAPGKLPTVVVHSQRETTLQLLFVAALIVAAVCDHFDQQRLAMGFLAAGFICIAITWAVHCSHIEFPGIVTFRDLVECLLADTAGQKNE